jgi:hypothetical protein
MIILNYFALSISSIVSHLFDKLQQAVFRKYQCVRHEFVVNSVYLQLLNHRAKSCADVAF